MRPSLGLAALLAAASLLAGACSSGEGDGAGSSSGSGEALASPVTVEHRFGTTTIKEIPKRIVTIDLQWTDVMLAMGVEPVAYSVDSLMPESGPPWQELPGGAKALALDDGVPVEQILALEPDLVLSTYSLNDEETYSLLANRVPTIVGPKDDTQVTPWQDLVRTAGKFLDRSDRAEEVIGSVDEKVTAAATEFTGLKDRTFTLAQYIVGDAVYVVADEKDGSSLLFGGLGMRLNPDVLAEGRKTGDTRVNVGTERADLLRADLLVFLVNGGDESDLADIPGFADLPGTVALLDYPTVVGLNTPSPLSIPYVLDELRPKLAEASGGGA